MCGLVVTVSFDGAPADPVSLQRSCDVLAHRGPDDSGIATYGSIGFGFRRLAILDLSPAGHQPMESLDGRLSIVFNGEIYNYLELRRELQQAGYQFTSSTDTEVLLQAYAHWGAECVNRLNGMWAFVIYDRRTGSLFASRDRFGVKPLYRWTDGKSLVLASEIKAIVASGLYAPRVNWQTASSFLCHRHLDHASGTFFEGVEQVPPGSTLSIDLRGNITERRFWSVDRIVEESCAHPIETFRDLFEDAVRLRMRSDVPVGVCLSGGIDSNAIISMMTRLRTGQEDYPLHAFSYIPPEFSEADYIHETIEHTGAVLNELQCTPRELWDLLPTVLWYHDEPVHSPTALIGFQLMHLARGRGVIVVLNGQGADEVNAGYHAYFRTYWSELLQTGEWRRARQQMSAYAEGHGRARLPLIADTLAHWLRSEVSESTVYARARSLVNAGRRPPSRWYVEDFVSKTGRARTSNRHLSLRSVLARSVERRPLPLYLRVEDRNSMAHSVEARLPFLDYRLVALAFSLRAEWKLNGPWNKYIVREAMKGVIAEPVRTRKDKMGFPTPSARWFAGDWFEPVRDVLASKALRESGICNVDAVLETLDGHRAGHADLSDGLFHLAEFALWLDKAHRPSGAVTAATTRGTLGALGPRSAAPVHRR